VSYGLKTPLDINKTNSSATYYRTHLGDRHNATHLAINLIGRAVQIEKTRAGSDPLALEFSRIAEPWAISHIVQGCFIEEYHQWEKAVKQCFDGQRELNDLRMTLIGRLGKKCR
jgi:hypothetical protein